MLGHGNGPGAGTLETKDDDDSKKSRSISLFGISNMGVHISRYAHLLVQEFSSGGPAFKRKHLKLRNENNLLWNSLSSESS